MPRCISQWFAKLLGIRRLRVALMLGLSVMLGAGLAGCTRRFFRTTADRQVEGILKEKTVDPRWHLGPYHVYPDPRARFADPTNPDRPPKPPDDQAAYSLSPNPQIVPLRRIAYVEGDGYMKMLANWDEENRREAQERERREGEEFPSEPLGVPGAGQPLTTRLPAIMYQGELPPPVTVSGVIPNDKIPQPVCPPRSYLLKLDQAIELSFVNSRNLQTHREDLYLAALPVAAERFAFAAQFYTFEQFFRRSSGPGTPVGNQNSWLFSSTAGVGKLFSTGALMLAAFANTTVVNLGHLLPGAQRVTSQSTLSFDIIQPLLRGGGRAVTLEPLTQAERNLLYTIRDFVRFQQEYYAFIAAGQPVFIPGVQPGVSALEPGALSLTTPIVPFATALAAPVGTLTGLSSLQVTPGAGGGNQTPIQPISATPQGYFPTIIAKVQLANYVKNLRALENFYDLLQVYQEGGTVNPVQVDRIKQTILTSLETVLANQRTYRNALDQFKVQLGVPPAVKVELDIAPLRPMFQLQRKYEAAADNYQKVTDQTVRQMNRPERVGDLRNYLRQLMTDSVLVRGLRFQKQVPQRWAAWEALTTQQLYNRLDRLRSELRRVDTHLKALKDQNQPQPEAEVQRLHSIEFEIGLGVFELRLRDYEARPWVGKPEAEVLRRQIFFAAYFPFLGVLEEAVRERLDQIRDDWPAIMPVCVNNQDLLSMEADQALTLVAQTALENRLDLMNQRAQLVDAWRKVRVAANALLGTFNVEYNQVSYSPAGHAKPFAFNNNTTNHQLIFNAQPPLVRMLERNNYRSVLINYQQFRRFLMLAEDQIVFEARLDLRQVRDTAYNYHVVQKQNFPLAYLQRDRALQAFLQPATPPGPSALQGAVALPSTGGNPGDPAALTSQLLAAQASLLLAQNDLYSRWILYQTARIFLYRDMGLMPLDNRGVWIDDVAKCECNPAESQRPAEQPNGGQPNPQRPEQLPEPRVLPSTPSTPLGTGR